MWLTCMYVSQYIELKSEERESKCGQMLEIKGCDEGVGGHYSDHPFIFTEHLKIFKIKT